MGRAPDSRRDARDDADRATSGHAWPPPAGGTSCLAAAETRPGRSNDRDDEARLPVRAAELEGRAPFGQGLALALAEREFHDPVSGNAPDDDDAAVGAIEAERCSPVDEVQALCRRQR